MNQQIIVIIFACFINPKIINSLSHLYALTPFHLYALTPFHLYALTPFHLSYRVGAEAQWASSSGVNVYIYIRGYFLSQFWREMARRSLRAQSDAPVTGKVRTLLQGSWLLGNESHNFSCCFIYTL